MVPYCKSYSPAFLHQQQKNEGCHVSFSLSHWIKDFASIRDFHSSYQIPAIHSWKKRVATGCERLRNLTRVIIACVHFGALCMCFVKVLTAKEYLFRQPRGIHFFGCVLEWISQTRVYKKAAPQTTESIIRDDDINRSLLSCHRMKQQPLRV